MTNRSSRTTARVLAIGCLLLLLLGITVVPTESFPVSVVRRGADGRLLYHLPGRPENAASASATRDEVRRGPLQPASPPMPLHPRVEKRRGAVAPLKMLLVGEAVLAAVFAAGAAVGSGLANLFTDDDREGERDSGDDHAKVGDEEGRPEEKKEEGKDRDDVVSSPHHAKKVVVTAKKDGGEEQEEEVAVAVEEDMISLTAADVDVEFRAEDDAIFEEVDSETVEAEEEGEESSSSSKDIAHPAMRGVEDASELLAGDIMDQIMSEEEVLTPNRAETANVKPTPPRVMTTITTAVATPDAKPAPGIDTDVGGISVSGYEEEDDDYSSSYIDPSLSDLCYLSWSDSDSCPDTGPGLSGGEPFGGGKSSSGSSSSGGMSGVVSVTSAGHDHSVAERNGHHVNGGGAGSSGSGSGRGHLFANEPDLIAPVVSSSSSSSASSSNFGIRRRDSNGSTKVAPARTDDGEEEEEGGMNGSMTTAAPRPRAAQRRESNGSMTSPSTTLVVVPNGAKKAASAAAGDSTVDTVRFDATTGSDDDERHAGEVLSEEGEEEAAGIASSSSSVTNEVTSPSPASSATPEVAVIEDTANRGKEKGATSFDDSSKGANDDGSSVAASAIDDTAVEEDDEEEFTPHDGDGVSKGEEDTSAGSRTVADGVDGKAEKRMRKDVPSGGITDDGSTIKSEREILMKKKGRMESKAFASNGTKGGKEIASSAASEGIGGGPPHDSSSVVIVEGRVRSSSTISKGDDRSSSSSSSTAADKATKEWVTSATDGERGVRSGPMAGEKVVVDESNVEGREAKAKFKSKSKASTTDATPISSGGAVRPTEEEVSSAGTATEEASGAGKVREGEVVRPSIGVKKTKASSTAKEGVVPASGKVEEEEKVPSVVGVAKTKATTAVPGEEGGRHSAEVTSSVKAKKEPSALDKVEEGAEPPTEGFSAGISVGEASDAAASSSPSSTGAGERPVVVSIDAPATADANEKKVSIASSEEEVGTSTTKAVEENVAASSAETDSVGSRRESRREEDSTSTASSRRNSTVTAKREEGGVDAAKGGSPSKAEEKGGSKKKRMKKTPAAAVERGEMQASSEEEGPIADIMRGKEFNGPAGKDRGGASKDHPSVTNGEMVAATVKEEVPVVGSGNEDLSSRTSKEHISFTDDKENAVESSAQLLGSSKNEVSPSEKDASKMDASTAIQEGAYATTKMDAVSPTSTVAPSTDDAEEILASISVKGQDESKQRKRGPLANTTEDVSTADESGGSPSAHAGAAAPTAAKVEAGISRERESNPTKAGLSAGARGEVATESWEEVAGTVAEEERPAMSMGARPWTRTSSTEMEQVSSSKEDPSAKMRGKPASAAKLVVSTDDLLATIGRKVAAAAKDDDVRSSKDETFATKEGRGSAALVEDEVVSPPMEAPFDGPDQRSWDSDTKKEKIRAYEEEGAFAAIEEIETAVREEAGQGNEVHSAESRKFTYTSAGKKEVDDFLFEDDPPSTKGPVSSTDNTETDEAISVRTNIEPAATIRNDERDDSMEAQSATTAEEVAMSAEEIKAIEAEIAELKGTLKSKRFEASRLEHEADDFSEAGYLRKRGETNDARKRMGVASASDKYLARTLVVREFLPVFDDMDALVDSPLVKGDSAKHYAIPALLFGLKAKLADLDVTEYGMSHDEADIVGGKIDVRRFAIVGEEFSNEVPNGSVLKVVRSGLEIKGNVVRLAECVISRGAEDLPFVAPVTPPVVPHAKKPTSMGTRISANSASTEPLSPFEQRMRSWHGQEFDNQSSEDPGSGAKPFASASALGGSSDSGSGPGSKPSLHIWSGPSGSGGSGSGLGGSSDSNLSGSASLSKRSDASSSSGPHSSLLSSSSISSPPDSLQQSPDSFSSTHSGNSDLTGSSRPLASGPSGSDSYSESPLHSRSGDPGHSGLRSGLGGSSDSVSSGRSSNSKSPHAPLSDDSVVSRTELGLDGSSHSLLSSSGPQSNPSLLSSGGRGGSRAAFGGSSNSMYPGRDSDSNASIHSFSGYSGSNGPSSGSILGSSVVPSSSSPLPTTFDHSSHIHSGSTMSSWGPRKTSFPEPLDSGSHPAPAKHSGSPEGVQTSFPPVTIPGVHPVKKPTTFVTPSHASRNSTEPLSTFDLRMRRWHDVKSRVPGGRSKPFASGSGLDGSSSFSSLRSPSRTKSSQRSSSDHSRSGESISGVNGSPSSASPGPSSPSQTTLQPPARHRRSSRPSRKEEVGSSGSNSSEELVSSSSDSQTTLSRDKSSNSKLASLSTGPVGSTSSRPGSPRESSVQSPSVHSITSSSTESSFSGSKTNLFRHSSPGNSESDRFNTPDLSSNRPEEVLPPEPPVTPPEASLTPSTKPTSGGSYLDALSGHTDSVEPASFGRSTSSKHESNSARESGYLSGLARETTPTTSPSPNYSTPRRTNLVSGGLYLEALSGPTGLGADETTRTPSFSRDGYSNPVASVLARRSNDLAASGSGSKTEEFRQLSGFPDRRSSVAPASRLSHPGEVQLSEPTEALPATSPTPDGNPVSTCSYLDALSGPGDDSVEPTQYRNGKISKQASKSARESGYSSQLAQGTPPATSLTPTHSTSRSTRPVSKASYLDALSSLGASNPGDALESASFGPDGDAKPAVSSPAQGSNDLESRGSDSRARLFHQSSSGLSERSTSSAAVLNLNHPEETSSATSSTPHGKPVFRGSYLEALSGSGDDSVESTPYGRSTSSKHESHSARESGFLSGLAPGTPPAASPTPTYSTSRRTNTVSGASYLEALSGTGGSDPGDIVESSSEPVASNREQGSNYLSGLDATSSSAGQSYSAHGPVQHSGSTSLRSVPPVMSPVAVPDVSPVVPRSKSVYPPAIGRPGGSYLDALADLGGTLDPSSNCLSDGSRPDASSPTAEKSYSSGLGTTSSSACRRNGTPVPEQSSYSRPLVPPPALSFVTPPIDRRSSPPATSGGSLAGRSLTTHGMVGNSYLDALAHQQGSLKTEPSGVKPFGVGLPPRTSYVSELGTNSQFASQPYSSPAVSPRSPNSDPYGVDPAVAPPTSADENALPPPENRFPGQS